MDIPALSAVVAGISGLTLVLTKLRELIIGASTLRASLFFHGRLSDLKYAREHLGKERQVSMDAISESRIFRFLFGFEAKLPVRNGVFEAITKGFLTEAEVRLVGPRFRATPEGVLYIEESGDEKILIIIYLLGTLVMWALGGLLVVLTSREPRGNIQAISFGVSGLALAFGSGWWMLREAGKIVGVRTTRKLLQAAAKG